jgi:hypothetical protein
VVKVSGSETRPPSLTTARYAAKCQRLIQAAASARARMARGRRYVPHPRGSVRSSPRRSQARWLTKTLANEKTSYRLGCDITGSGHTPESMIKQQTRSDREQRLEVPKPADSVWPGQSDRSPRAFAGSADPDRIGWFSRLSSANADDLGRGVAKSDVAKGHDETCSTPISVSVGY